MCRNHRPVYIRELYLKFCAAEGCSILQSRPAEVGEMFAGTVHVHRCDALVHPKHVRLATCRERVAGRKGSLRWRWAMSASFLRVVTLGCPVLGRFWTDPVKSNFALRRIMVVWLQLNCLATARTPTSALSIPMAWARCSFVNRTMIESDRNVKLWFLCSRRRASCFWTVRPSVCQSVSLSVTKSCAHFSDETADRRDLKLCTMLYYHL